jgi:hypothetical protein
VSDQPRSRPALHHPTCQATPRGRCNKGPQYPCNRHIVPEQLCPSATAFAVCALAGAAGPASHDGRLVRGVRGITEHRARARRSPPARMPTTPPRNRLGLRGSTHHRP